MSGRLRLAPGAFSHARAAGAEDDPPDGARLAPRSEPAINAPWPVLALIALLVALHGARAGFGLSAEPFALTGEALKAGHWSGLVTHIFAHASWTHLAMNSGFILAFGTPVARRLGSGPRGALSFLGFFVVCGVCAGLAFAVVIESLGAGGLGIGAPDRGGWAMVGASGAASGLMGAAARIMQGKGRIGPMGGNIVVSMALAWILMNAILGLTGLTPGTAGAPVAWEAHIFGFVAGLLLIGVFARAAGLDPAATFTKR